MGAIATATGGSRAALDHLLDVACQRTSPASDAGHSGSDGTA
ncbi:hypothetical protein ONA70_17275 [Micromonospora yasonensis]|nr:hypothetical protein [Micromonospora yasonensis]MCW3841854.1 hypothetical protein [Micromonospora yasonensis]